MLSSCRFEERTCGSTNHVCYQEISIKYGARCTRTCGGGRVGKRGERGNQHELLKLRIHTIISTILNLAERVYLKPPILDNPPTSPLLLVFSHGHRPASFAEGPSHPWHHEQFSSRAVHAVQMVDPLVEGTYTKQSIRVLLPREPLGVENIGRERPHVGMAVLDGHHATTSEMCLGRANILAVFSKIAELSLYLAGEGQLNLRNIRFKELSWLI